MLTNGFDNRDHATIAVILAKDEIKLDVWED